MLATERTAPYPPRGAPAVAALLVFGASLLLYLGTVEPPVLNAADNLWYVPTAQSLLADGNFELLGQYAEVLASAPTEDQRAMTLTAGRFNYFGFGPSVAVVPLVALGNTLSAEPPGLGRDMWIAAMAARVLAALSVGVLLLLVFRLTADVPMAIGLAVAFAVATPHLAIHAGGLWASNVTGLCYLLALWCLAGKDEGAWCSIFPLAFAFYCRPGAAAPLALTLGYFMITRQWRNAIAFAAVGLVLLAVMMQQWHMAMGVWLPPYHAGESFRMAEAAFGRAEVMTALVGTVISPNRGLWVFMPLALLSTWGAVRAWGDAGPHRHLFRLCSLWCVAQWGLIATYPHWWLGHSLGPRGFAELFGVLVVLLVPAGLGPRRTAWGARLLVIAAVVLGAAGLYINARVAYCPGASSWNGTPRDVDRNPERVWDLADWQVGRARCATLSSSR